MIEALDNLGLADDTVVVIFGDHGMLPQSSVHALTVCVAGWQLGEHNTWAKMSKCPLALILSNFGRALPQIQNAAS